MLVRAINSYKHFGSNNNELLQIVWKVIYRLNYKSKTDVGTT